MVVGAIGVAKDKNVLWFGTQSNQTSLAPSIVVANQVYKWDGVIKEIMGLIEQGTMGGKAFAINLANQGEVIEFNPDYQLPADVSKAADDTIKGIADGTIKIDLPTQ